MATGSSGTNFDNMKNGQVKVGDIVYIGRESQVPFRVTETKDYLVRIHEEGTNYHDSWLDVALVRKKK